MFFLALWEYQTSIIIATSFMSFQLVHGVGVVLPIECEIPYLKLVVEFLFDTFSKEECLIYLEFLDEHNKDNFISNKHDK